MATTTNFGWETPDDTDLVKDGAAAIRTALGGVDTSFVDLKGGTTGQVLAKASGTDLDFSWAPPASVATSLNYAAGKNAIINGDFTVWQRGTSVTLADNGYSADRYIFQANTGTMGTGTVSRQTFTPGTAPVAGYEGLYFLRYNLTATGTSATHYIAERIENVQTFAGQTATFSFWGKADSARTVTSDIAQVFGSGGSGAVITSGTTHSFTTSWTRFTVTFTVPSISGKTIGTGSYLAPRLSWTTAAGVTIDTWGWQLEAGSTATAFQTATGTIQGELAACQRYYYVVATGNGKVIGTAFAYSATQIGVVVNLPVQLRTDATLVSTTGTDYYGFYRNSGTDLLNSFTLGTSGNTAVELYNNSNIASTAGDAGMVFTNNASASIALSAEL